MPDYPFLILPTPTTPRRATLPPFFSRMHRPSSERQIARFQEQFSELESIAGSGNLSIRTSPTGYEPEQVLVLETVGTLQEFESAVRKLDGLDWLTDVDIRDIAPDEHFYMEDDNETSLTGRLFLLMFNQQGLQQLLSLWEQYRRLPDGHEFERGKKKWAALFDQLRDVRRWAPQDRIGETGLQEALNKILVKVRPEAVTVDKP